MVRLVIAHKHTHKHLHHPIRAAPPRSRKHTGKHRPFAYVHRLHMRAHTQTRRPLFGCSALQQSAQTIAASPRTTSAGGNTYKGKRRCGKSERCRRRKEGGAREGAGREKTRRRHREAEREWRGRWERRRMGRRAGVSRLKAAGGLSFVESCVSSSRMCESTRFRAPLSPRHTATHKPPSVPADGLEMTIFGPPRLT